MKQDKQYHFCDISYLGKFSSVKEAEEYAYKLYGVDPNDIRFKWHEEDTLVFTNNGIRDFIKDFNLDNSFMKYFNNNVLDTDYLYDDLDNNIISKIADVNISKYLDIDKTKEKVRKKFDLIRLDKDDYFINGNTVTYGDGGTYFLSSDNIDEQIKSSSPLKSIFNIPKTKLEKLNLDIDDKVGDTIDTDNRIDLWDRDSPFIYINGEIIIGEKGETHSELLQEVYHIDINHYQPIDMQDDLIENVDKQFELKSFGTGQIIESIGIIDSVTLSNCTEKEVADKLIKEPNIKKVYVTEDRKNLTRLAKLIWSC